MKKSATNEYIQSNQSEISRRASIDLILTEIQEILRCQGLLSESIVEKHFTQWISPLCRALSLHFKFIKRGFPLCRNVVAFQLNLAFTSSGASF